MSDAKQIMKKAKGAERQSGELIHQARRSEDNRRLVTHL